MHAGQTYQTDVSLVVVVLPPFALVSFGIDVSFLVASFPEAPGLTVKQLNRKPLKHSVRNEEFIKRQETDAPQTRKQN